MRHVLSLETECERDEQELAELEILFAEARLQRPSKSAQENVTDTRRLGNGVSQDLQV